MLYCKEHSQNYRTRLLHDCGATQGMINPWLTSWLTTRHTIPIQLSCNFSQNSTNKSQNLHPVDLRLASPATTKYATSAIQSQCTHSH